ncbi:hypothetical protein [Bacillus thuringiensis]|uniref:hypothetical protein n=1 Tax=Bacillus thuringiensis TaxID=1428 RepID=UPI00178C6E0D|nr:hypothetical protein [Bacillus thuringiensis]
MERMTVDMLQDLSFDDSIFILFLTRPGTGFLACSTNSGYCSLPVNSSFLQVRALPYNYPLLSYFALFRFLSAGLSPLHFL